MPRAFTLEEANALIPRITMVLCRTTQMLGRLRALARRLGSTELAYPFRELPNLGELESSELAEVLQQAKGLAELVAADASRLEAAGLLVRDIERGLVDFRSIVDGQREVFLSWQLGEQEILYFCELHGGFAGRQPVEGHRFFRTRQLSPPRSDT